MAFGRRARQRNNARKTAINKATTITISASLAWTPPPKSLTEILLRGIIRLIASRDSKTPYPHSPARLPPLPTPLTTLPTELRHHIIQEALAYPSCTGAHHVHIPAALTLALVSMQMYKDVLHLVVRAVGGLRARDDLEGGDRRGGACAHASSVRCLFHEERRGFADEDAYRTAMEELLFLLRRIEPMDRKGFVRCAVVLRHVLATAGINAECRLSLFNAEMEKVRRRNVEWRVPRCVLGFAEKVVMALF